MTWDGFLRLAIETLTKPRDVAALLISLNLPREVLILAFVLVAVLNTVFFGLTQMVIPPGNILVPAIQQPVMFGISFILTIGALILALTASGRAFDGGAQIEHLAVLIIWLQALRAFLQAFVVVISPVSLLLAGMLMTAAAIIGIWILVHFIDVAHGLGSMVKSGVVLLIAVVGMLLVLTMIFSLLGISPAGVAA